MSEFDIPTFLKSLPLEPGVYRFIGKDDQVLYVGKARQLKKRVSSYFQKNDQSPRIRLMLQQVLRIDITVTRTEAEALLLENNLIKSLTPRYNILFRDDKTYPYIVLSGHASPRLAYYRGAMLKGSQYFGPFPNGGAARETIQLLQKVFRLRTCEDSVFNNRSRPCLLYQIKRCSGPCVDLISTDDYRADVKQAADFLSGRENELVQQLTEAMENAAASWQFEEAAILRDRIQMLVSVQQRQFVSSTQSVADVDVVVAVVEQGLACVNLAMIRGGRHLGDKHLFPVQADECAPVQVLQAFLAQHYLEKSLPGQILVFPALDDDDLKAGLETQAGGRPVVNSEPTGERRMWLEMAIKNAQLAIGQRLLQRSTQEQRLSALQEKLGLPEIQRLECFDISHTLGENTVASCVVYDACSMQPSEYRRYNITGITPGDDYAAMRDVLTRRYSKIAGGEGKVPDIILIDGGKGQVGVAVEVMNEVGLTEPLLIGVAKGEERKPGLETLVVPAWDKTLQWPADHPALHLIQQIRDEAHRFAITGHRAKRAKQQLHSRLEDIPGVGPKRRKALLTRFGGLKGVGEAAIDDLKQVDGINQTLAEAIYNTFHDA